MEYKREYYLGLDMGTASVGWAVTDRNYNLLRAKGKDLWGIREFEEASPAVERRTHRIARRRREREKVRIGMLKDYFSDAITAVDANFFERLENSKYDINDKDESVRTPNGIFNDNNYTDKEYYKEFPTIFHLRKKLIEEKKPQDVRLVYLALLNMFKHRGHFLNMSLGTEVNENNIKSAYGWFCECVEEILEDKEFLQLEDSTALEEILSKRDISRMEKAQRVVELLHFHSKDKCEMALAKGICGLKMDLTQIYKDDALLQDGGKLELCFSDFNYEEKEQEALDILGEEKFELIRAMKNLYDVGSLSGIMKGHAYLSQARVAEYDKHKEDLIVLKRVFRKYVSPKQYQRFFRKMEEGTYSAYVNSTNVDKKQRRDVKGRTKEDLYKTIKEIIKCMPQEDEDVVYIKKEMECDNFLLKQLTASNGVIPNQIHVKEMKKILNNAEEYLPFLLEKDDSGLTVSERILKLFSFVIPYYIGPVSEESEKHGGNGWVVRREQGQVLPWNIETKIDMKETSERFIERMVRKCTYISGETALPKASLLYERFCVLNEINNIRVYGEKIPVELKQDIYTELFEKGKRVKRKQIEKYLIARGVLKEEELDQLTGIDIEIHSSLSSYGKFKEVLGEEHMKQDQYKNMVEDIIRWCTVYGEAKRYLKERMEEKYKDILDDTQIKRILGFKLSDWGNLSKVFLQLSGVDKATGEVRPLIRSLWETNDNLMELLSADKYTYIEELESMQENVYKTLSEITVEDLDELYFSAPVKRMVWQTLLIIKELEKVLGCPPKRIFVEMIRNEQKEKRRTTSRKQQFLDLYKNIKGEATDWKTVIEKADGDGTLRSKKMYLYLTQKGRCMYTGNPIDLDALFNNNLYDIDHIYPRHFVKDDNLENNLVLVEKEKNAHKKDIYPLEKTIFDSQIAWWRELHHQKLISDEKFKRLTGRNSFSEEQLAGFIARQLVETSQGTKGVSTILKEVMPDATTIVYAKAANVSEFRQKYDLMKTRLVNDCHHANDAYLNIVVGNAYYVKFTQNPMNFIVKEYGRDKKKYNYNLSRMFEKDIVRENETAWVATKKEGDITGTIATVKKVMAKTTPLLTRLSFEGHGGIAEQTLYSAKKAAGIGYIPLKASDEKMQTVTKYGGFCSVTIAYYALVEHEGKKGKRIRTLEAIPVYMKEKIEKDSDALRKYCEETLNLCNPDIRVAKIKLQSMFRINGYPVHLTGKTGNQLYLRNAVQIYLSQEWMNYIKKLENYLQKGTFGDEISKEKNIELYDILLAKHQTDIIRHRMNPILDKLVSGREKFEKIDIEKQSTVLSEILKSTQIGAGKCNLANIGGSPNTGILIVNKKISGLSECRLMNQSVTGLYEKTVDLLTV